MIEYAKNEIRNLDYVKFLLEGEYIIIQNEGNYQCIFFKEITEIDTSEEYIVLRGNAISVIIYENYLEGDNAMVASYQISDDLEELLELADASCKEVFNNAYEIFRKSVGI